MNYPEKSQNLRWLPPFARHATVGLSLRLRIGPRRARSVPVTCSRNSRVPKFMSVELNEVMSSCLGSRKAMNDSYAWHMQQSMAPLLDV